MVIDRGFLNYVYKLYIANIPYFIETKIRLFYELNENGVTACSVNTNAVASFATSKQKKTNKKGKKEITIGIFCDPCETGSE